MGQQQFAGGSPEYPPGQPEPDPGGASVPDARTPLFRAFNSERYQRQDIIRQIQARTGRRLICYIAGNRLECMISPDDTMPFVDLLHKAEDGENIDMMLHTNGGSVDAAEKLIRLVRSKVGNGQLRIIVPELAKSAGTVMVLGADIVLMSDTSELGPIDPQMPFADAQGTVIWQSVQNYLDAYDEHYRTVVEQPDNDAAKIMLDKVDPQTVNLCRAVMARARQSAESLLLCGMFRNGGNNTLTVQRLLDTRRWLSHSQMISWEDAKDPTIGLKVKYLSQEDELWQDIWRLYCLQRLEIEANQKLYESDYASLKVDAS